MTRRFLSILSILLIAFAAGCTSSGGGNAGNSGAVDPSPILTAAKERGSLRVGMSGDQPPFNFVNKAGNVVGLDVDIAQGIASVLDLELQIVQRPFGQLVGILDAGEVDLVMSGMAMTPRRNTQVAFVGPYFISGKAILTKSDTLASAVDADEINEASVRIAALSGSTSQEYVERALPDAQLTAVSNYDDGVQAVIDGRVDALVADYPICVLTTLRSPELGLVTVTSPLSFEPIGIAMPPTDPLLTNMLGNYLNLISGTGYLIELQDKWFIDASWIEDLP